MPVHTVRIWQLVAWPEPLTYSNSVPVHVGTVANPSPRPAYTYYKDDSTKGIILCDARCVLPGKQVPKESLNYSEHW